MSPAPPDLAPEQWRVSKPRIVHVTEPGPCERDDCDRSARVVVTWQPISRFGQHIVCCEHVTNALAVALDDSPEDTQITVELLVPRAEQRAA